MAEFSASDSGLVGFKLLREHPMVVPAWAILELAAQVISMTLLVTLAGPAMMEMQNLKPDAATNPSEVFAIYSRVIPGALVAMAVSLVFSGIIYAGASRLVLRPEDRGFGWLKFGADELRQCLLLLVLWLILLGAYLGLGLAVVLVATVGALVATPLAYLLGALGALLALGALVYLAVRLSMASPATFVLGRLAIGESWRMTKGRFWNLFGAFLLAAVLALIVGIAGAGVFFVLAGIPFGFTNAGAAIMSPDMTSMATMFTTVGIAYLIWQACVSGVTSVIFLTPAPTIYRQLSGEPDVFD